MCLGTSTTKTGCHDIAEILLKVALKHQKSNQSLNICLITNSINFVWSLTTNQILSHLFSVPKHMHSTFHSLNNINKALAVLVIGLYELLDPST
jgi:hypothetical protein